MVRDLDALGERAQVIPPIAALSEPDPASGLAREFPHRLRRDRPMGRAFQHGLDASRVGVSLIADRRQPRDPLTKGGFGRIERARLDSVVETLEAVVGLGSAVVQLRDVVAATLDALLPAVHDGGEQLFQPLGIEQAVLDMADDDAVQLVHRDRTALAAGLALPGLDRAGIIAVAAVLAGAQRHGAAAIAAIADAGEQGRAADHARRRHLRIARPQALLDGLEDLPVDQWGNGHRHDLFLRLHLVGLGAPVELVLAHIGAPGQDAVKLADAPAPTVAGEDAVPVEMGDDSLHAHGAGRAVALQREAEDQPHGVGVERVDFELLLHLRPALLGINHAVADWRQRAVPESLPGILLQRAQDVLGVLLRLILVEQRHDLTHHDVHGIVAHLLGDGDELDAVLGKLPDIEFQLEVIAEESREAVNDDDIEGGGLARARLDHALELGSAVVGCD